MDLESKVLDMGDHLCLLWYRFIYLLFFLLIVFFSWNRKILIIGSSKSKLSQDEVGRESQERETLKLNAVKIWAQNVLTSSQTLLQTGLGTILVKNERKWEKQLFKKMTKKEEEEKEKGNENDNEKKKYLTCAITRRKG